MHPGQCFIFFIQQATACISVLRIYKSVSFYRGAEWYYVA